MKSATKQIIDLFIERTGCEIDQVFALESEIDKVLQSERDNVARDPTQWDTEVFQKVSGYRPTSGIVKAIED